MKKIALKLQIITILLLCFSLKSWSQSNDYSGYAPLRGVSTFQVLDSSIVIIPIDYLRKANIKLIERKYLLNVNKELNNINSLQLEYISEQDKIIVEFQNKIKQQNEITTNISKNLDRQKKISYALGGIAGGVILTAIIVCVIPKK